MAHLILCALLLSPPLVACNGLWRRDTRDLPDLYPTIRPRITPYYVPRATNLSITRPPGQYSNPASVDCTVVIPQAGLDWWFTHTYIYATSTYQFLVAEPTDRAAYPTAYTVLTSRTPLPINVTSSLASPSYVSQTGIVTFNGSARTVSTLSPLFTPTPVAPHTTVHTRSSVRPIPTAGIIPYTPGPVHYILPSSAYRTLGRVQTTLAEAEPNATRTTITSTTPFLRFTNYEVVSKVTRSIASGSAIVETVTSSYNLTSPIGYALAGSTNLDGVLSASGTIPPDFTNAVGPQSSCSLSSWYAEPTVIVVVEINYAVFAVLAAHTEVSQLSLDIPTPSISDTGPGASDVPHDGQESLYCTKSQCSIVFNTGHLEMSQTSLDVPSSFVFPGPTQSEPPPEPTLVHSVPRRQQTIGGVVTAALIPAPLTTSASPTPDFAQVSAALSLLLSISSRVGATVDQSSSAPPSLSSDRSGNGAAAPGIASGTTSSQTPVQTASPSRTSATGSSPALQTQNWSPTMSVPTSAAILGAILALFLAR